MKNLITKEFKLSFFPMPLVFLLLSALVLVPSYPYYVTFFYTSLGIFLLFQSNRENHDIEYMMCLPIKKRDMVKSRILHVIIIELAQVIICIPFCIIRSMYAQMENPVGIEANAAFLGFGLIMLALFNIVFLPMFYKTANKIGLPFLVSSIVLFFYIVIMEVLLRIVPFMSNYCDTMAPEAFGMQLIPLALGIVIYSAVTFFAYKRSAKHFEKLDLAF